MRDGINSCADFLKWALPELKMRPEGFRKVRKQVCKRLLRRMSELSLHDFGSYRSFLQDNPSEWKVADEMMRITISRFFRDKNTWEEVTGNLLPEMIRKADGKFPLRCWCAGIASGEEPYTLAILWRERLLPQFPNASLEILATDSDPNMLERARMACYNKGSFKEVPPGLVAGAFHREGRLWCLDKAYREMVKFSRQDIREEIPEGIFDLIFCRNIVAMYFNKELAVSIFKRISTLMRPGAYLILGNHEEFPLDEVREIREFDRGLNIYRKNGNS
jgi:chemotaxis protein methyltransferase CheR